MSEGLPAFLTVEEAAALLRIGRTKAYAMTREWRDTNGKSGLPVADLRGVLRVPLKALEAMAGGALDPGLLRSTPALASVPDPVIDLTDSELESDPQPLPARRTRRQHISQLDLFDLPPAS